MNAYGYDYTQAGAYFVTVCTYNRECLFGKVVNGEMRLNRSGAIVAACWEWLPKQYAYVDLDVWGVMPNHLHGIIAISDDVAKRKPLGRLIGAFKTVSTKRINEMMGRGSSRTAPTG